MLPIEIERTVERHHASARRALPYVVALLAKVAGCDGRRNAKLNALCDAGQELADVLDAQIDDEERELFPALLSGSPRDAAPERARLDGHHREVGLLLALIRSLADGFVAPEWGSRSYRVLMEELDALERDLVEHMSLERSLALSHEASSYVAAG